MACFETAGAKETELGWQGSETVWWQHAPSTSPRLQSRTLTSQACKPTMEPPAKRKKNDQQAREAGDVESEDAPDEPTNEIQAGGTANKLEGNVNIAIDEATLACPQDGSRRLQNLPELHCKAFGNILVKMFENLPVFYIAPLLSVSKKWRSVGEHAINKKRVQEVAFENDGDALRTAVSEHTAGAVPFRQRNRNISRCANALEAAVRKCPHPIN